MADEWISQTDRKRVAVEGQLAPAGGPCTLLFIEDSDGWLVYPFGLDQGAVRLTGAAVRTLAHGLCPA